MATKIFASKEHVTALLGVDYVRELTFPQIFKDSELSVFPVVVARDGRPHVVVGAADAGAHAAARREVPFSTAGRYFDWNQGPDFKAPGFVDAVLAAAGEGPLEIEATMPVARFEALAAARPVTLFGQAPEVPVHLYTRSAAALEAVWRQTRDADVPRLDAFVSTLRFGAVLAEAMRAEPLGFAVLDRQLAAAGLDALLVSAPFNAEMFTGLPGGLIADLGLTCLYRPGVDDILVISERPIVQPGFVPAGAAANLGAALAAAASGRVGFEKGHLPAGSFQHLQAAGLDLADGTHALRRFFDERAGTDLVYFIVAANAVLAGFEYAKAFLLRTASCSALLETDVAAVFHQGVAAFAQDVGMQGRVLPYFDIIHPGARTLLPAMAGRYPISAGDETIKFDMGLLVTDSTGVVRGCSDIARSMSPDPALQAAHDKLRALLVDALIPAIKPGMSGSEIHAVGIEVLRPMADELKACGLLHADMSIDGYTRDCGHTLQRQTLATVHFLPGFAGTLHAGMLGCTEFVWPIDDKIIACEDGYYVTPDGAVPFTV